jgi:hypothetical protein
MLPEWAVILLMAVILGVTAYKTFLKGFETRRKDLAERKKKDEKEAAERKKSEEGGGEKVPLSKVSDGVNKKGNDSNANSTTDSSAKTDGRFRTASTASRQLSDDSEKISEEGTAAIPKAKAESKGDTEGQEDPKPKTLLDPRALESGTKSGEGGAENRAAPEADAVVPSGGKAKQ